ncbi:MAG: glycosyltransferase family 4 protein [Planctomycetota bacterium]
MLAHTEDHVRRVVFATFTTLGFGGGGGPAAHLARALASGFKPSLVLAGGDDRGVPPDGSVRLVRRAFWRRILAGTRLHRLQMRSVAAERTWFDRVVASRLPACRLVVAENSLALLTFGRAAALGAMKVLLYHNLPFRGFRDDLLEEQRRWGGPVPFITEELLSRTEEECREADRILVFSELVRRELEEDGVPAQRIRRLHFGVDADRFRPSSRPHEGFTVAFVGWLSLRKGYPYLVEGFRKAAIAGSRLLLHGGTSVKYDHALVARLKGGAAVEVVRGPVEETLRKASVLVLPSVSDGFGLVVPEAFAAGLPVVVTDRCGAAEIVREGENGFVIPSRDPHAVAERLRLLADDPERRAAMGAAARETALTLKWETFEQEFVESLAELLDR